MIMVMRIKFNFTHKYYGFLKKHTKMWWRTVKKELVKNGIGGITDTIFSVYIQDDQNISAP